MNKIVRIGLAIALLSIFAFHCSRNAPTADGSGSHTGNPVISGILMNQDRTPAANAVVTMVPVDYVPSIALLKTSLPRTVACTTDSKGEYRIYSIDSLCYNFEARRDTCGVFHDSVKVVLDSQEHRLDTMTLASLGRVYGVTKMPGQNDTNQVRVTLYIPGTQRITKPAIGGAFMFDRVPAGHYQMIIDPTLNTYNVKVMNINVLAGQDLNLDTVVLDIYQPDTININQSSVAGTWGPGKVYNVLIATSIPQGQTLTILPGTTIKIFDAMYNRGKLFMQGKQDSLIIIENGLATGKNGYILQEPLPPNQYDTSLLANWVIIKNMATGFMLSYSASGENIVGVYISNCAFVTCVNALCIIGSKAAISNCVFWKNNLALLNYYSNDSISITNSILIENDTCINRSDTSTIFDYCLFYNNPIRPADSLIQHSFYTDPLFVRLDSTAQDFHLQSGSPCLGTGLNGADIGLYSTH